MQIFYAGLLDTLDEKAQTVIFANVEDILLANTAFLSDLEERQRETRLYVDRVGDVVRSHMGDMGVYTVSVGLVLVQRAPGRDWPGTEERWGSKQAGEEGMVLQAEKSGVLGEAEQAKLEWQTSGAWIRCRAIADDRPTA